MKKTLLIVCILLGSLVSFGQNIAFDELGNVQLSEFENYADNQPVKIVLKVSNAGGNPVQPTWGIGTINPINKEVHVNTTDWSNDAKYTFVCQKVSEEGADNIYEFTIADFKNFAKVDGEYYVDEYNQRGLTIAPDKGNGASLASITVEAAAETYSLTFDEDAIGTEYAIVGWGPEDLTAVVSANPAGEGNALKVNVENWNSAPLLGTITLPDNKTLADVEKLTFGIYLSPSNADILWKTVNFWFGEEGATFAPDKPNGSYNNLIKSDALGAWLTKIVTLSEIGITSADILALNKFDLAFGIHAPKGSEYYLDNISFVFKTTGINTPSITKSQVRNVEGGIIVNGYSNVSVYSIDGRLVKQAVAGNQTISLAKGLYIVKAGSDKAVKVLVK